MTDETDNYDWLFSDSAPQLETGMQIGARSVIRHNKRRLLRTLNQEMVQDVIILPQIGESLHLISNGIFDFYTLATILIEAMGGKCEHLYASTWTINQQTILDLFDDYDNGRIAHIHILSDVSFKRRKTSNYARLIDGLREREQRFIANHNHSKVVLLNSGDNYLSIEGSASFTTNPRLEHHVISNDYELWNFHRDWMTELLDHA